MGKSIIPIGMSMGVNMSSPTEGTFDVLIGDELEELAADEWMVWGLSHENPQAHYEHRFDRDAFVAEIEKHENTLFKADMTRIIDKLLGIGVLAEIDLKNEPLEPFFRKYTIVPTARSFGNTVEDQSLFGIGNGTEPELWVNGWVQTIWAVAHHSGSLWESCRLMADSSDNGTATEAAASFAEVLPAIVASEFGFLEPAK